MWESICALRLRGHPYEQIRGKEGDYALICTSCKKLRYYRSVKDVQDEWQQNRSLPRPAFPDFCRSDVLSAYPTRDVDSVERELVELGIDLRVTSECEKA